METFLDKEPLITNKSGAVITFHKITWDLSTKPFSICTDGNINYSSYHHETKLHTHELPEIILLISGSIKHIVNNETQEINPPSILFIRPNDTHSFKKGDSSTCELISFSFNLELMLELSRYLEDDNFIWNFTESPVAPVFKISEKEMEKNSNSLLRINELVKTSFTKVRIKIILSNLFTTYFLDFDHCFNRHIIPKWFLSLCNQMNTPQNLKLGLVTMKKDANCTQEHLCKVFRKYLDQTPTEFINELRMKHAKILLQNPSLEIFEISQELGFKSLSRFYHLFKKQYGIPPAQYKKNEN